MWSQRLPLLLSLLSFLSISCLNNDDQPLKTVTHAWSRWNWGGLFEHSGVFWVLNAYFPTVIGWFIVYRRSSLERRLRWSHRLITFSFSTVLLIFCLVDSISRSAPQKTAHLLYTRRGRHKSWGGLNNELKSSTPSHETFAVTFSESCTRAWDTGLIWSWRLLRKCIKNVENSKIYHDLQCFL